MTPNNELTPTEMAIFVKVWKTTNHTLNNLITHYHNVADNDPNPREIDLVLFATALQETIKTQNLACLLALAIERLNPK